MQYADLSGPQTAQLARQLGYPNTPTYPRDSVKRYLQRFITNHYTNQRASIRYIVQGLERHGNEYSGEFHFTMATQSILSAVTLPNLRNALKNVFDAIVEYVVTVKRLKARDKIQVLLTDGEYYLSIPFTKTSYLNFGNLVLRMIIDALQSMETLEFASAVIQVKYGRLRAGGAYFEKSMSFEEFVTKKKAITKVITYEDRNDCFYQCLAMGLDDRKRMTQKQRETAADSLRDSMDLHVLGEAVPLVDIPKVETLLGVNIYVIQYLSLSFIYTSPGIYDKNVFMLFNIPEGYALGHFHLVAASKVGSLWNKRKFCFECMEGYQDVRHRCIKQCIGCKTVECVGLQHNRDEFTLRCETCNTFLFDHTCRALHKCGTQRVCKQCHVTYTVGKKVEPHLCGLRVCSNCGGHVDTTALHECFMQELKPEDISEPSEKYIFYDYESYLEGSEHKTAGIVAMLYDNAKPFRFETDTEFMTWIMSYPEHTCIAHNGGRYDMHYIKKNMLERGIKSSDISNGNTLFYSYVKAFKVRFIDSYRFIPIGLRMFPKTFGIRELTKGYFPYRFFTKDNLHYQGRMPDKSWFDFDSMKEGERALALEWYDVHQYDTVNLYEMCMEYCESDVALLREGCIRFRKLFMDITQGEIDPFRTITIASTCMNIYRRFYLPSKTIGVLDNRETDMLREAWLRYAISENDDCAVFDMLVADQQVDAYSSESNTVYLYGNCIDTGCPKCYNAFTLHPVKFKKCHELNWEYREKIRHLEGLSYTVEHIKQCVWTSQTEYDVRIKTYCEILMRSNDSIGRTTLSMRDAFFGGRTEPLKLYYACNSDECIRYVDYTSLYPTIQYGEYRGLTRATYDEHTYLAYPVGHPVRITENFESLDTYFGFACVTIQPPEVLYHPVLPEKKNGKLVFDLCLKTGTWTTVELMKAIQMGYTVLEIHEVLHFPQSTQSLFKDYVRKFLKIKQQAAGWNKLGCVTDQEKFDYCQDYLYAQGIDLDMSAIGDYNPGLYFIAKLCLNSLWGKFGQRDQFSETIDTFDWETFEKYTHNDQNDVTGIIFHNNMARTITYKKKQAFSTIPKSTNIAVAAFTTAYARLRLYEALEILGERVLYTDTDSIIFVDSKRSPVDLVCGPFLGDLTDELDGDTITEFVSTGPKSYAYKTVSGKTEVKVKGFTLNHDALVKLNFKTLCNMVCNDPTERISTPCLQFIIAPDHTITTKSKSKSTKEFGLTFDKRQIDWGAKTPDCLDTRPFKKNKQ